MGFHILVLAGGSGTRLWPLSRAGVPKHLLPLGPGGEALLRTTVDRVASIAQSVSVVTATSQAAGCMAVLGGAGDNVRVIAEPTARGTGPAIGLAVTEIASDDPGAVVASVHADAHIGDDEAYRAAIVAAAGWAEVTGGLSTVGLTPTHPSTGLGYIALGPDLDRSRWRPPTGATIEPALRGCAAALPAATADGFIEKPARALAEQFLGDGRHLWNLGLFAWPAGTLLAEIADADGGLAQVLREVVAARRNGDEEEASRLYEGLAPVAVEPLVFERTRQLTVVKAAFAWSDLGSWADLAASRAASADADGNVVEGDAVVIGSSGSLVESRGGRTVTVVGAEGMVVVDTGDAVLVMPMAESQRVKEIVERLRGDGRHHLL